MTFTATFNGFAFGGPGSVFAGAGGSGGMATFILYVDPSQVVILPEDASIGDIDPTQVEVIQ